MRKIILLALVLVFVVESKEFGRVVRTRRTIPEYRVIVAPVIPADNNVIISDTEATPIPVLVEFTDNLLSDSEPFPTKTPIPTAYP